VAQLTDTIKKALREKREQGESPIVVIVDFTLVVGMDSSAAHAVAKLKKIIHRFFHIEVSIFVTGSDRGGFPCEFALSQALCPVEDAGADWNDILVSDPNKSPKASKGSSASVARGSVSLIPGSAAVLVPSSKVIQPPAGKVCESLDEALIFAEDMLVARTDPTIKDSDYKYTGDSEDMQSTNVTLNEEKFLAKKFLTELCAGDGVENLEAGVTILLKSFTREIVRKDDVIWNKGNSSDCAKLVVLGKLMSYMMEGPDTSEVVKRGDMVGELGLVHGTKRLTTLVCDSENAVLYSLDRQVWQKLKREHPEVAGLIDSIVILYLAHRVQHVSNRYFGRTLPV
jgi:CRP-like cAMP-binding protein